MSTASKGRRVEHKVRAVLEANGYWVCRAAGSKGEADLVAIDSEIVALVNVKSTGWPGPEERNALAAIRGPRSLVVLLILWPKRQPPLLRFVNTDGSMTDPQEWHEYAKWKKTRTIP